MSKLFCPVTLGRYCGLSLSIIIVLFALTVSLFRGLLPQLAGVRLQLIDYIETQYQVKVHVEELSSQWEGYGPAFTIKNFTLPIQQHIPFALKVNSVQVQLDFWQSLTHFAPEIEMVSFDGVSIELDLDKVKSIQNQASQSQDTDLEFIYALLLEQLTYFELTDTKLQLIGHNQNYSPIYINDLKWYNKDRRHNGQGKIYLDDTASESEQLQLIIDIYGSGYHPDSLQGELYLAAKALDIGEWFARKVDIDASNSDDFNREQLLKGGLNAEAWIEFTSQSIESGLVKFHPSDLSWMLAGVPQKLAMTNGAISFTPNVDGWLLKSHQLEFETDQQPWPELTIAAKQHQEQLSLYISQLDVESLQPLLALVPDLELSSAQQWQQLNPQGGINNIKVQLHAGELTQASAQLTQLTWNQLADIPGISPLDIDFLMQGDTAAIKVHSELIRLDFGKHFQQPLVFEFEPFQLEYLVTEQRLNLPSFKANNDDIAIDSSIRLDLAPQAELALAANMQIFDVSRAHLYFPLQAMSDNLVEYLTSGLIAGEILDANIVWRGALTDYPYADVSGIFQAGFSLAQAQFEFQPDWPTVTSLNLNALFENDSMRLKINQGKLLNVTVDGATVEIEKLGHESLLEVDGAIEVQSGDATDVMLASPLADTVGQTLQVVQIQDQVKTVIDLDIPLYDEPQGEPSAQRIAGSVYLQNTPIFITKPGILLDDMNGEVNFVNEVVTGKNITASLFQQPVLLNFNTEEIRQDYGLDIELGGRWQLDKLATHFPTPLDNYYTGEIEWNGMMTLIFDPNGYRIQAQLKSDLLGTELQLPPPFAKDATEIRGLSAELIGDHKQLSFGVRLSDKMEFWSQFQPNSNVQLAHYDLILGRLFRPGDMLIKQLGNIHIELDQIDFISWMPLIKKFVSSASRERESQDGHDMANVHSSFFPSLKGIVANIANANLMGQQLTKLAIQAQPTEQTWRVSAISDQFVGDVDFYPDWATQGVKVVAQHLYLAPDSDSSPSTYSSSEQQVFDSLPPLAVDVNDFSFYGRPLGHLVLQGEPKQDSYLIQRLSLRIPGSQLIGQGRWSLREEESTTEVNFTITADKFNHLADRLAVNPGIMESPLKLDAELNWTGAPYTFDTSSLNGRVIFELGKGYLSEVSDKGARIFSLFSLESILRKLSLDFSDVFGKGLYFSSFTGSLNINNGVVNTTDTEMDGVAGMMNVRGYTDLTLKSLNYDIRFVPQLASSVPAVVLLSTGGVAFGLGALALTKVLEPVIEVITEIRFRLTGTMEQPLLEEVSRKSKEIEIPESIQGDDIELNLKTEPTESPLSPVPEANQQEQLPEPLVPISDIGSTQDPADNIDKELSNAGQSTAVSKFSRCSTEPQLYRFAA